MFETYIVSHLADLVDGDIEESLEAIQGTGASGVTLVVSGAARTHLRCQPACNPRILRSRGGYYYQPDPSYYTETHLKPVAASWVRHRQSLDRTVAACRQRNLKIRLRISAFEVGRVGDKHADAAAKSVFGDVAAETLCPANPDVRALLRGTVRELQERFTPDGIELNDVRYHSGALGFRGLAIGFDPGEGFLGLLGICFSESSRQAAGERDIDTDAAARWVQVHLDKVLTSGRALDDSLSELLRDAEIPRRYVLCQQDTLDALLVGLVRTATCGVHLVLPGDGGDGVTPTIASIRTSAGIILESDLECPDDAEANVKELRRRLGEDLDITLDMDVAGELGGDAPELVATVKAAADHGASAVSFSEWGLMPASRLAALKQGIRYAVRSSG
ncbi:MAG TPA: hypothetical protein P5572_06710 [Phycisphaerae bacterium]|nr:hypothetical protein [Phycisphaerales bacterium]HRX84696.1 hypothetical protein [Phycisphaerae bacterium]